MELLLDTANISKIRKALDYYPISGLTTNPSIMKAEGKIDFWAHMREIQAMLGKDRTFHVQVISKTCDGILREADVLRRKLGEDIYIKTPVSKEGLKAISVMSREGFNVTATAIYTTFQAQLAMLAGARYLAMYYNRMLNLDIDADKAFRQVADSIREGGHNCKIVGASFKNVMQLTNAIADGAQALTVPPDLLDTALANPSIDLAVENFRKDWSSVYGDSTLADL
ncbi:MAG: fructose-6-phosphate aldolase [Spirochaetales bacterium]|nr:fructose-6-phosphate aldolase [Spirochaetales bacterium]